jgi:hypothetical protein
VGTQEVIGLLFALVVDNALFSITSTSISDGKVSDKICRAGVCRRKCPSRLLVVRVRYDRSPILLPPGHFLSGNHFTDILQVQWGSQDHYEIVRKVGRGKYSEVRSCQFVK